MAAVIELIGQPVIHRGDGRDIRLRGKKTRGLPLVLALFAELDLHAGRLDNAGEQLICAWAMAAELGDQCWLSVSGRALGLLAERRGHLDQALRWLNAARSEPSDNPDVCRWIEESALDSICELSVKHRQPQANTTIAQLAGISAVAGMPDYVARASVRTHRQTGGRR